MKRIDEIKLVNERHYVGIGESYGGNQAWFRDGFFSHGDAIYYGGCGLIAMADMLLYLSEDNHDRPSYLPSLVTVDSLSRATYQLFVNTLFYTCLSPLRNPFFKPKRYQEASDFVLGIQGWQLKRGLKKFLRKNQLDQQTISFLLSRYHQAELTPRICQQLRLNRPVPLLIGPTKDMFPKGLSFIGRSSAVKAVSAIDGIDLIDESNAIEIVSHWVTITAYFIDAITGNEWVVIASWGKKYLLDFTAYKKTKDWVSGVLIYG